MAYAHPYSRIASCAARSSFRGVRTGMPCSLAHALVSEGVSFMPRPEGASGDVMTMEGTKPRSTKSASVSRATYGVPKKAKLSLRSFIAARFILLDLDHVGRVVDEQDSVQVVGLVLEDLRQDAAPAPLELFAILVVGVNRRALVALRFTIESAH